MDNQITIETSRDHKRIVMVLDGMNIRISVPNKGSEFVIKSVFSDIAISPKSANEFNVKITDR